MDALIYRVMLILVRFYKIVEMKPIQEATTLEVESLPSPAAVNLKPPLKIERNHSFDDDDIASKPVAKKSTAAPVKATVYSVADLQMATDSFNMDNLIGEGTFGRVYRAQFSDGKVNGSTLSVRCFSFLLDKKDWTSLH